MIARLPRTVWTKHIISQLETSDVISSARCFPWLISDMIEEGLLHVASCDEVAKTSIIVYYKHSNPLLIQKMMRMVKQYAHAVYTKERGYPEEAKTAEKECRDYCVVSNVSSRESIYKIVTFHKVTPMFFKLLSMLRRENVYHSIHLTLNETYNIPVILQVPHGVSKKKHKSVMEVSSNVYCIL
jgi:hypothetical protein